MRPIRFRFGIRTLLALVAAVAVSLGAVQTKWRWDLRQRCVAYHRVMETYSLWRAYNPTVPGGICGTGYEGVPRLASDPCHLIHPSGAKPGRPLYLRDAAFHARVRRHYESSWW